MLAPQVREVARLCIGGLELEPLLGQRGLEGVMGWEGDRMEEMRWGALRCFSSGACLRSQRGHRGHTTGTCEPFDHQTSHQSFCNIILRLLSHAMVVPSQGGGGARVCGGDGGAALHLLRCAAALPPFASATRHPPSSTTRPRCRPTGAAHMQGKV